MNREQFVQYFAQSVLHIEDLSYEEIEDRISHYEEDGEFEDKQDKDFFIKEVLEWYSDYHSNYEENFMF